MGKHPNMPQPHETPHFHISFPALVILHPVSAEPMTPKHKTIVVRVTVKADRRLERLFLWG